MEGRYRFEPVAVETTRINGKSSTMFLDKLGIGTWQLGQKGNTATGDRKEKHRLLQRIFVSITRGNTDPILATDSKSI